MVACAAASTSEAQRVALAPGYWRNRRVDGNRPGGVDFRSRQNFEP